MKNEYSLRQVLTLIVITLAGVIASVMTHYPLVIGFLPGFIVLILLTKHKNVQSKKILHISLLGVNKTKIVIFILFLVSFLLPSWYLSGTINQMVKIALHFITPNHFILFSFIISMVISLLLGTTVGTLSSIGIPILGTAAVLHLPMEMVAGALISGSFVGDRTSPFSSSHQLLSHTLEVPITKQGKAMLITTISAIVFCVCFYSIIDLHLSSRAAIHTKPFLWKELSLVKFIPPFILIGFVLFRISIVYAFLSSILSAAVIAIAAGVTWSRLGGALWYGINGIGGGFIHMYELLLFLALAGAYNGILEEMNVIQPYLDKWLQSSKSFFSDTLKTIAATLIISFIAANQTLPIILTGRSFLPHWSRQYNKEELARVMGDTTMLFPGMIPWSVLAIMCSTIVGVPLIKYLPYTLFLWILPILTLALSFVKQRIKFQKTINKTNLPA
jgi:NhaC family Na+:H+ antiporter